MKINWKTRLKNPTTLTALISAVLLFAKQIADGFGLDISVQVEQITGIVGAILAFLTTIGVLVNPNTKGTSDAGIDMLLTKPRNQEIDPVVFKGEEPTITELESWNDEFERNAVFKEGLRDVEDSHTIRHIYNAGIENSGVKLDTNLQVEGVISDENTNANQ